MSAACQPTLVPLEAPPVRVSETAATVTPRIAVTSAPTQTPRAIAAFNTQTNTPSVPTRPFTDTPPILTDAVPDAFLIGHSVDGRGIMARRFGTGEKVVLLVGGTHGGWEANTVTLITELIAHFEQNPADVLSGVSLVLIPTLNPDGMIEGMTESGRFNANGVDLNRNWACGWRAEAYWRDQVVSAGERPFSEPETQALSQYILTLRPAAVLFYHSMAGGVFAGECSGDHGSAALAAVVGEATGYRYGTAFSAYPVTGTAPSWVDGQGIPAVDVELETRDSSEFDANLRGVLAVQRLVLD